MPRSTFGRGNFKGDNMGRITKWLEKWAKHEEIDEEAVKRLQEPLTKSANKKINNAKRFI